GRSEYGGGAGGGLQALPAKGRARFPAVPRVRGGGLLSAHDLPGLRLRRPGLGDERRERDDLRDDRRLSAERRAIQRRPRRSRRRLQDDEPGRGDRRRGGRCGPTRNVRGARGGRRAGLGLSSRGGVI
ncbi:MAG: hypothetical protein AVDCRST_MAG37-1110, partial [uncultured Rubrobacteraceae bacterium]